MSNQSGLTFGPPCTLIRTYRVGHLRRRQPWSFFLQEARCVQCEVRWCGWFGPPMMPHALPPVHAAAASQSTAFLSQRSTLIVDWPYCTPVSPPSFTRCLLSLREVHKIVCTSTTFQQSEASSRVHVRRAALCFYMYRASVHRRQRAILICQYCLSVGLSVALRHCIETT